MIELPPYPYYTDWTKDLEYYEGPLLTLLCSLDKQYFLKYWCDYNPKEGHSWLIFLTYNNYIDAYKHGRVSLRELMDASCKGKSIYLQKGKKLFLVEYDKLPENYKAGKYYHK